VLTTSQGSLALGIIAVFLPPLAVVIRVGCGVNLLVSILLLFLGWLPAVLHAWHVILEYPNARQRHRAKSTDSRKHSADSHRPKSRSIDSRASEHVRRRRSYDSYRPREPGVDLYFRQSSGYAPEPKLRY